MIRAPQVRLIDDTGKMVGIVPLQEALRMSEEKGYDLVEVASNVNPPVCRMMDYGQYKYELAKKQKEAKKKQKIIKVKEIKVRPKTDEADLRTKCNKIKELLEKGDKVKVTVFFRGRERIHVDLGFKVIEKIKEILGDSAAIEKEPTEEGSTITMILQAPPRKK